MKKLMSVILVVLLLMSAVSVNIVSASDEDFFPERIWNTYPEEKIYKDYKYRINRDNTAEILKYLGDDKEIITPAEFEEYIVTRIDEWAFYNNQTIEKVTISEGVLNIDNCAFGNCTNLKEIYFPSTLKTIGINAFNSCINLTSIELPNGFYGLADTAFYDCTNLSNITVPNSILCMGSKVFENTAWYKNQPEGLIYLGNVVYEYKGECPEKIEIEHGTVCISSSAFLRQSNLAEVIIPDSVISASIFAFEGTAWLANQTDSNIYAGNALVKYDRAQPMLEVEYGTVGISSSRVWSFDKNITTITIPDTVKYIDVGAFNGLRNLEHVDLGNSVELIAEDAFVNCWSLKSITIPPSVKTIGDYALGFQRNFAGQVAWHLYCENFTIYGYEGTEAERYANFHGFTFVPLDKEVELGDADNDGNITVKDATLIQKAAASLVLLDDIAKTCADVNSDNTVNVKDATAIQKFVAGIITEF